MITHSFFMEKGQLLTFSYQQIPILIRHLNKVPGVGGSYMRQAQMSFRCVAMAK